MAVTEMRHIGVLTPDAETDAEKQAELAGFAAGLRALGWSDGDNIRLDYRWGGGDSARLPELARELVRSEPDLILCRTTPVAIALRRETRAIPLVFVNVSDPVGAGLAASLERPGGNVTGLINIAAALGTRWRELFQAIDPGIARVGVMFDPTTTADGRAVYQRLLQDGAGGAGIEALALPVRNAGEIERSIAGFAAPGSGLLVQPDITTTGDRARIIALTAQHRLPAVYAYRFIAAEGGLAALGIDVGAMFRRAAGYADRILRGADPGALAIEGPSEFALTVNRTTAAALGLALSPLLVPADEVIG
jgi:putative ABC transport system substrate-binding protein